MQRTRLKMWSWLLVLACAIAGYQTTPAVAADPAEKTRRPTRREKANAKAEAKAKANAKADKVLTGAIPKIKGPRRTVAVGNFDAIGSFKAQYGDQDIGGGTAAMLVTALLESQRFIVVERANINQVLAEQELAGQGLTQGDAAPKPGRMVPAQWMIYGAVTEFGAANKGGGFSLGVNLGGRRMPKVGVSPQWTKGKITMDVRVVDTSTGQIVKNFKVSERVSSKALDLSVDYAPVSFGTNNFTKTPLGQATRNAITKVVTQFAGVVGSALWTGRVVEVDGNTVYINAGSEAGIQKGQSYKITRTTKTFTDPATGQVLGHKQADLGRVEIDQVEAKYAAGSYLPLKNDPPKRGDFVTVP